MTLPYLNEGPTSKRTQLIKRKTGMMSIYIYIYIYIPDFDLRTSSNAILAK